MKTRSWILVFIVGLLVGGTTWAAPKKEAPRDSSMTRIALGNGAVPSLKVAAKAKDAIPATGGPQGSSRNEAAYIDLAKDSGINGGGWGYGPGWTPFIAMNRFDVAAANYPFALFEVSAFQSYDADLGENIRVVVLFDADGDGDPSNATILSTQAFTVGVLNGWESYPITPVLINGPSGDVYLGISYDDALGDHYPAGYDDESTSASIWSYEVAWGNCDQASAPEAVPNPLVWNPDCINNLHAAFNVHGAFQIRGVGYTPPPPILQLGTPYFEDICDYGFGNDDTFADPGETITFHAPITNAGFLDATNAVATLTSPYPITITSGTDALGTITMPARGTATADFVFDIPLSAACGTLIPLIITVTADQDPKIWVLETGIRVGDWHLGETVTLFTEGFDIWPPNLWTITADNPNVIWDGTQTATTCIIQELFTGQAATASMLCDYPNGGTTDLVTPPIAIDGSFESANLQFKTGFYDYYGTSVGMAQASADGGATWSNIEDCSCLSEPGYFCDVSTRDVSMNSYIGNPGLLIRFRYGAVPAAGDWPEIWSLWEVDDIILTAKRPDPCTMISCLPPFTVNILTPIDGEDLYGVTTVCAQVTDYTLVASVNWTIDGMPIITGFDPITGLPIYDGCQNLTEVPYCCTFDPQFYGVGAHTIRAEAFLIDGTSVSSAPVTFYTVGTVMAFPDAFPPSGLVPLTVTFTSNATWGSGQYLFDWFISSLSGYGGTSVPTTNAPTTAYTFNTAGDYLVTLFVTDTMGTDDAKDDIIIMTPPIKITVTQLATPFDPFNVRGKTLVNSL